MLLAEPTVLYRLSRSDLVRQRALRRIIRCEEQMLRLFGQEVTGRERRREPRHAIQVPINLRPAARKGLTIFADADAPPFLALTTNISLSGLGLVHDEPLTPKIYLAEFDISDHQPLRLVVEHCWTARPFPYAYRSGGRVLGVARAT